MSDKSATVICCRAVSACLSQVSGSTVEIGANRVKTWMNGSSERQRLKAESGDYHAV